MNMLLPCPFCGNEDVRLVAIRFRDVDINLCVECEKCGSLGPRLLLDQKIYFDYPSENNDKAFTLYNHRVPPQQHTPYFVCVANGAGKIKCSCGWESRVQDDGMMFITGPDGYNADADFKKHVLDSVS